MPTADPQSRLKTIREYIAGSPEGREIAGLPRDEKIEWTYRLLDQVRYESLSKSAKGMVRRYLQSVTGYSRAHVERHISGYRRFLADGKRPQGEPERVSLPEVHPPVREAQVAHLARGFSLGIPLLLGATVFVLAVGLTTFSSQLPLLVASLQRTPVNSSSSVANTAQQDRLTASTASPLPSPSSVWAPSTSGSRIAVRRTERLAALALRTAKAVIVPTPAQDKKQFIAWLSTISGTPSDGEIIMFKNGKPAWANPVVPVGTGRRPGGGSYPASTGEEGRTPAAAAEAPGAPQPSPTSRVPRPASGPPKRMNYT